MLQNSRGVISLLPHKFSGKTLREKHSGPFRLTETSYSPDAVLPIHQHQTAYLSFLLAGDYQESCASSDTCCAAGTVMWHPPNDAHADLFASSGGHLLNLEINDAWLKDAAQELKPYRQIKAFRGGLPYALGLRLYRELHSAGGRGSTDDLAYELVSFFFSGQADQQPPRWLKRALDLVQETYDHSLSLADTAKQVGVHPVHLARSFRRFLGCTFGDHVAKLRIRKAFELLLSAETSIAEVAHASGFADHAHLCRSFKSTTGLTPSAFIRQRK